MEQPIVKCSDSRRSSILVEDHFAYIYTSGTTGLPKVGFLSAYNIAFVTRTVNRLTLFDNLVGL